MRSLAAIIVTAGLVGDARAQPEQLDGAALEGEVTPGYIVGPGDRLLLEMWGIHELTQELDVTADGRLLVPRVGSFSAAGQTLQALRTTVEGRAQKLYPRLEVSLTLVRPRVFLVHVTGAVTRPGTYRAGPMTRVSALLPRAGGALAAGSLRRVEIRRGGAQPIVADLVRFSNLGESDCNPTVLDGDTIFVPTRGLTVEVTGAVARPGRYELVGEPTLDELLVLAGGRVEHASSRLPVRVTGRQHGDRVAVRSADVARAATTLLQDGDVVHVPELEDDGRAVVVEGAVVGPPAQAATKREPPALGERPDAPPRDTSVRLPFVAGDGVRDLIVKAGGLEPWADARGAYLLRDRRQLPVDVVAILAGERRDLEVAPGDTLMIPTRRRDVLVSGAVQRPGLYQYSTELKPRDYLSLAGGATRLGDTRRARVLSQNGASRAINKVGELQPGDVITVPERTVTTAEWTTIVLIIGNIAVGAAAVGLAATR
jgi:protein involved in polysaccharide export with SLBB domain